MTKIRNQIVYIPDTQISGLDYLVGTDADQTDKPTVSFRIEDLGGHFNMTNGIRNFDYIFYQHAGPSVKPSDGYFYSNDNEQDPNNITHFIFSKKTNRGVDVSSFFQSIIAENPFDLIVSQKTSLNTVFFFRIESVTEFSGYFKLNVSEVFFPANNIIAYSLSHAVFNVKSDLVNHDNRFRYIPINITIGAVDVPYDENNPYEQAIKEEIDHAFSEMNLTVAEDELIVFVINISDLYNNRTHKRKYLFPDMFGKGDYLPLAAMVTSENIELVYVEQNFEATTPEDLEGSPNVVIFDLGDITGEDYLDYINDISNIAYPLGYPLIDPTKIYFFKWIDDDVTYLYYFDEANSANSYGYYGVDGEFLFAEPELVLFYQSDNVPDIPPGQDFQSVTDNGSTTTNEITTAGYNSEGPNHIFRAATNIFGNIKHLRFWAKGDGISVPANKAANLQVDPDEGVVMNVEEGSDNSATRLKPKYIEDYACDYPNIYYSRLTGLGFWIKNAAIDFWGKQKTDTLTDHQEYQWPNQSGTVALTSDIPIVSEHYKGKYTSLANLEAAHPTGSDGDTAIVDAGPGTDAIEYIWDAEEGWVQGNSVGALDTDGLPQGSTNLYFAEALVRATLLTGLSLLTGTPIVAGDSILVALGKLQKQITDLVTGITPRIETLTSADLVTRDIAGFITYANALNPVLVISKNEEVKFLVTDTKQVFGLNLNNRSIGFSETPIVADDVIELEKGMIHFLSSIARQGVYAISNGVTGFNVFNIDASVTGTGQATTQSPAQNLTSTIKSRYITGVISAGTAGSSAGIRSTAPVVAFGVRPYVFEFSCAGEEASVITDVRSYSGIKNSNSAVGNVEPSTLINCVFVGNDSTDTNMQVMHNDGSGTCSKIDLGSDFPAKYSVGQHFYTGFIYVETATSVYVYVEDTVTGKFIFKHITSLSGNLPATVQMYAQIHRNNAATATAVICSINGYQAKPL